MTPDPAREARNPYDREDTCQCEAWSESECACGGYVDLGKVRAWQQGYDERAEQLAADVKHLLEDKATISALVTKNRARAEAAEAERDALREENARQREIRRGDLAVVKMLNDEGKALRATVARVEALADQWRDLLRTESQIMTTAQRNAWTDALFELATALAGTVPAPEHIQLLVDAAPDLNPNALQRLVKVTRQIEGALLAADEEELRAWLRTMYRTALQDDDAIDVETGLPIRTEVWDQCVGCGVATNGEPWCSSCKQRASQRQARTGDPDAQAAPEQTSEEPEQRPSLLVTRCLCGEALRPGFGWHSCNALPAGDPEAQAAHHPEDGA